MKKIIFLIVIVLIVVAGGWWYVNSKSKPEMKLKLQQSGITTVKSLVIENSAEGLMVDVGSRKLSMVDIKFKFSGGTAKGFKANGAVFNSEMLNKTDGKGGWQIVLGVMKSTSELPTGKVLLGKFDLPDGVGLTVVDGRVTVAAVGNGKPEELKVKSVEVSTK